MERSNNWFRISPLIPITGEIKKAHGINLNSMAGQRISTYAYSVNIFSACIYRIRIFCNIMQSCPQHLFTECTYVGIQI